MTNRIFLVETVDDKVRHYRRLTFPDTYKVTFGPLVPFARSQVERTRGDFSSTTALRVYRGKDDPVMVVPHVLSFREIGPIKVEIMELTNNSEEVWREDTTGEVERHRQRTADVVEALTGNHAEAETFPF